MNEAPAARLQQEKEQARALLAEGYAQDWIDQGELDRRMEAVERATAIEEVRALTTELRPVESTALVPATVGEPQALRVLLGSLERAGAWTVAPQTRVKVTLGSAVLDLREAVLAPGPLAVEVRVLLGSLEIFVPPGWRIDNQCGAILGAVEQGHGSPAAEGRVLRLTGRVVLGSLTVQERGPPLPEGRSR